MVERPAASLKGSIERDDGPPGGPQILSKKQIKTSWIQFIALCWTLSLTGWNDGSTGPLLPRIQDTYHVRFDGAQVPFLAIFTLQQVGFAVVSLIFVFACLVRDRSTTLLRHENPLLWPGVHRWCSLKYVPHG